MSSRLIAIATASVALLYGLASLALPAQFLAVFGVELPEEGLFVTRVLGVFVLGYAALDWYARDDLDMAASPSARRAVIAANLVVGVLGFGVHLHAQVSGLVNALGWTSVALFLVISIGWASAALRRGAERTSS